MKKILRGAVCMAMAFLLAMGPAKAWADPSQPQTAPSLPQDVGATDPTDGGSTTFGIIEVAKWKDLLVTVRNARTKEPIPGVTVQLFQGSSSKPITGSDGSAFVTGGDGTILFHLSRDSALVYYIIIEAAGYERYAGGTFTLRQQYNEQVIDLFPRHHGGGDDDEPTSSAPSKPPEPVIPEKPHEVPAVSPQPVPVHPAPIPPARHPASPPREEEPKPSIPIVFPVPHPQPEAPVYHLLEKETNLCRIHWLILLLALLTLLCSLLRLWVIHRATALLEHPQERKEDGDEPDKANPDDQK